jgi:hypothetical protein
MLRILPREDSFVDSEANLIFFIETELETRIENTPAIILLDAPISHTTRRVYMDPQVPSCSRRAVTPGCLLGSARDRVAGARHQLGRRHGVSARRQ